VTFGIQYSSLSGQIQVGRINKAGTEFTQHEYQTNPALYAVAEYVVNRMGGSMYISRDGKRYDIDVTEVEP
jgi:hypothetical protein